MNSRALLLLVDIACGIFKNDVGEHRCVDLWQVRAKADADVERAVDVQVDRRPELVHRFAFQTYEESEGVTVLLDADPLRENGDQAVGAAPPGRPRPPM